MRAGGCVSAGIIMAKGLIGLEAHIREKVGCCYAVWQGGVCCAFYMYMWGPATSGGCNPTRGHELTGRALAMFCVRAYRQLCIHIKGVTLTVCGLCACRGIAVIWQ